VHVHVHARALDARGVSVECRKSLTMLSPTIQRLLNAMVSGNFARFATAAKFTAFRHGITAALALITSLCYQNRLMLPDEYLPSGSSLPLSLSLSSSLLQGPSESVPVQAIRLTSARSPRTARYFACGCDGGPLCRHYESIDEPPRYRREHVLH